MTTRTLFDADDPDKVPPKLPHNGTTTSRMAAELAAPFAGAQQQKVFQAIEQAGANGLTDQEIETALGIAGNSVRPRRTKLMELGRIKDSGNLRLTKSGRAAVVWIVAPPNERPTSKAVPDWPLDSNPDKARAESVLDFAI